MIWLLGWLLYGLVVGLLAKLLHPGEDPVGFVPTIGIGIAGSFVGGGLQWLLRMGGPFSPAGLAHRFPSGWKVFGENLFAWHSIFYTELPSYFFVFGVYDDSNRCLSWADTRQFCREFGLETVPTIWEGVWDEALVKDLWNGQGRFPTFASKVDPATHTPQFPADFQPCEAEGYVVRIADQFHYTDFSTKVAKYVRKHHVQTTSNWMTRPVVRNLLQQ